MTGSVRLLGSGLLWMALANSLAANALAASPLAKRADNPAAATRATGAAAWRAIAGNTVTGTTPDGPYTEYFAEDGTARHLDRDGKSVGQWRLRDPLVCVLYPEDEDEECRTPEIDGSAGAFVDRDGTRYPFEILPGNARNL